MERWGVFSVVDHKDRIRLATEVLLYDKLAVPTPVDHKGPDWNRWEQNGWDPKGLEDVLALLRQHQLVRETSWSADRQGEWATLYAEARSDMARANAEFARNNTLTELGGDDHAALRRMESRLPYMSTREAIIRHLKGRQVLLNGAVEFYAAYQSASEFVNLHPTNRSSPDDEPRQVQNVAASNLLISNQLAVPDEASEALLERSAELATRDQFRRNRRNFYDWQLQLLNQGHSPQAVARELKLLVHDYNSDIEKHFRKIRWERAFTVMAVGGATLGAAALFAPQLAETLGFGAEALKTGFGLTVAGNAASIAVGKFQLTPLDPAGPARVAQAGAMFHDIAQHVGFEVRNWKTID